MKAVMRDYVCQLLRHAMVRWERAVPSGFIGPVLSYLAGGLHHVDEISLGFYITYIPETRTHYLGHSNMIFNFLKLCAKLLHEREDLIRLSRTLGKEENRTTNEIEFYYLQE